MQKKREYERLSKLFSGIEVLVVNPVGRTLERQPDSGPPASENPRGEPARKTENDSLEVERDVWTDVPPDGKSSDEVRMQENEHNLATEANPIVENRIDQPRGGQLQTADSNSRGWQKLGIGMLTGLIVTGIILVCLSKMHIFNEVGRLVLLVWEVLCGILGTFLARPSVGNSKKTVRDIWLGAIQWSLVPVWIALVIISLIYLLMFTSLFGI